MFDINEISVKSKGGTELMKEGLEARLPAQLHEPFQIICPRVREIKENKKPILWIHDTHADPELSHLKDPESRARFAQLVFCGNWQAQQFRDYLGVPFTGSSVIETAIDPIEVVFERDKYTQTKILLANATPSKLQLNGGKIRIIYTSTPQRGLEILVPVVEELAKHFSNIHLDVYSSFKIYGWDEADTQYEALYEKIRQHPNMTYHGFQSNDTVREALKHAHIFAYPSIWPECNSRSLIEAMSAGCICVHPNFAGLADTSGGITQMYDWVEDPMAHANLFIHKLAAVINQFKTVDLMAVAEHTAFIKSYADVRYNWTKIVGKWSVLLNELSRNVEVKN